MKKLYAIVLLGLLLSGYIGCGGGGVATTVSPGHSLVTMKLGLINTTSREGVLLKTETGIPPEVKTIRVTISAPDIIPSIVKIFDVAGLSSLSIALEVPNGLNRHVVVEAMDGTGNVRYRGEAYFNADGPTVELTIVMVSTDPIPPVFAGIDHVQDPTVSSLTLAWLPASDNVTTADKIQYLVYMSTSANGEDMIHPSFTSEKRFAPAKGLALVNGMVLFTVNGLSPDTTYYFKVRAMDERGNIDPNSVERSGKTLSQPPVFAGLVQAQALSQTLIRLYWNAATDDNTPSSEIVYRVYRSAATGGEDFTLYITTAPGVTFFDVTGLNPCQTYYFIVRAEDKNGNTDSNTVEKSAKTLCPAPPALADLVPGNIVNSAILSFSVMNSGTAAASNFNTWVVYGPSNTTFYCEPFTDSLAPGGSVTHSPYIFLNPNYRIIVDPQNTIFESNESNNIGCGGTFCSSPPTSTDCFAP
jgi:hypothetical protein